METITITKRIIRGKTVCNKRFDDYDEGFYGKRISLKEYDESRGKAVSAGWLDNNPHPPVLNIIEQITYQN